LGNRGKLVSILTVTQREGGGTGPGPMNLTWLFRQKKGLNGRDRKKEGG